MTIDEDKKKEIMNYLFDPEKLKNEMIKTIDNYYRNADPVELGNKFGLTTEEVEEWLEFVINNREIKEIMIMSMK